LIWEKRGRFSGNFFIVPVISHKLAGNDLKLIFRDNAHYFEPLIEENECPASSLSLLGEPLIVRNVRIAVKALATKTVMVPEKFRSAIKLIQGNFPTLDIQEYNDEDTKGDYRHEVNNNNSGTNSINGTVVTGRIKLSGSEEFLQMPLNVALHHTTSPSLNPQSISVDTLVYPWDFLNITYKILHEEITSTRISSDASVASSSIIRGPCWIEDDVTIDDFCKIKGPTFIGKGSFVGMSSLVRECMIGNNTRIGFNCEIGKSFFSGDDKIAHQNVILDSLIGKNVWFGGYSGTANVLLNRKNVKYDIGDRRLIDTGTDHFGAVVGNNCAIGASVIILPGRELQRNIVIQAGTVVGKKLSSEELYLGKTDRPLEFTPTAR
jgi:carbonic anhydrase/acetyltransferase-like protein (isoleucine patch superfamily)